MSTTDNDTYAYEEAEERRAMVKNLHVPMKLWYNSDNCDCIRDKYGIFPMFWQDLEGWASFKSVLKLYLHVSDRQQLNEPVNLDILEGVVFGNTEKGKSQQGDNDVPTVDPALKPADDDSKKRRRSRWGVGPEGTVAAPAPPAATPADPVPVVGEADISKNKKKSRWSVATESSASTAGASGSGQMLPQMMSHEAIQQTMVYQMQLKSVTEKLNTVVRDALVREQDPNRSPSPPPRYDGHGKRTNTREVRMREALTAERTRIIEDLMKLNPLYQPPVDFVKVKPFKKVYIPIKEHPNYNFIGLIIGPRGNTQRRLEKDTGAKVSIRGKGSVKEGRKNQMKGPDDDDELHVHIQGETEDAVNAAVKLVNELLVPVDDEKNEHKQKQLRELALINGTLREDEFCQVCGERGHKQFECPHRSKTFKAANVKCAICGDQSHPTRDCPLKESGPTNEVALDSEYNNFMAELEGGGGKKTDAKEVSACEPAAGSTNEDSSTVRQEENGVVTTERILNGNKKQTIIHSKTLLTGWTGTPTPSPGTAWNPLAQTYGQVGGVPGYGATVAGGPVTTTDAWYPYGQHATPYGAPYPNGSYGAQGVSYAFAPQYYDPTAQYNYSAPPPPPPPPQPNDGPPPPPSDGSCTL